MNIIIPLAGKGERFSKCGYKEPKPLIKVFDKCMIEYVLDNLSINNSDKIFIIYNSYLDNYNFSEIIVKKYQNIKLIKINDTKGAAETLYIGIEYIFNNYDCNKKTIVLDCDTFYTEDIIDIYRKSNDNMVFYTKNTNENPIYSYIELDDNSRIIKIAEKQKISDNANTGAYAFEDISLLHFYCKYILDNNILFNGEPYTSCVISEMIKDNLKFIGVELNSKNVFSLGTPKDLEEYINNTYAFLFDLDGTLVITDDIYFNVWRNILYNYNIVLTDEIFKKFIQGNNDKSVITSLLHNIDINLNDLSKLKDDLFIENIKNIKLIDGVINTLKEIKSKGFKCCIVTNCNSKVAREIINYVKIDNLIDFIISSNDCKFGKPNQEPYLNAINKYNIKNNMCIILEDSKTGLLSGKSVNPKLLIGIETIYNSNELVNYGVNLTIKNYTDFDISKLLLHKENTINDIKKLIKNSINNDNIININIDENKLKGGFIADVIGFEIETNIQTYNYILKYENKNVTNLSDMAKQLQLYNREYYFYKAISQYVNIKIPKFICILKDDEFNDTGLILENLFKRGNYKINLNLNTENIDISLKIVDRIAKMHSKFWNKNLKKIFPELNKNNDKLFCPFFKNFISSNYSLFIEKWKNILNTYQLNKCKEIFDDFVNIQERLSNDNLTFIHGDVKSPNIFYDIDNDNEPYFLDWQHCAIGKGVQDLIFFIIESFDISNLKIIFPLFINYYYKKLTQNNIVNYTMDEYERDIIDSLSYIPFFTAVWFGTIPNDELIDKNFPYFFIQKLFYLFELIQ
jgi:HAD superfamily hydrolase (TIGR01509 family)